MGLAAAEDDDGNSAGLGETISDDQVAQIGALMAEVDANIPAFCKLLKVEEISKLPVKQFDSAIALLKAKKEKKQ